MSEPGPERSFWDDSRGISALIGAMFLLAFAVILIAMNQAYVVPQENSEIEFQHFQDTRSDMVSVRSSVLTAGQADVSQYVTVQLGTNYPPRIFAVNPPPASGTLRTSEPYNITITNGTAQYDVEIPTRFIEYRPGYNELSVGSTWYENSILYLDETQDGGRVIYEDQQLVTDGNTLRITALQNEFEQSGTGRATLELYPTEDVTAGEIPTGDVKITVPTRLTADEYWGDAMQGQSFYDEVNESYYPGEVYGLNFSIDTSQEENELQVNTVGIREEPNEGASKQNVGSGSDGSNDDGSTNPPNDGQASFESVTAEDVERGEGNSGNGEQTFSFTLNETLQTGDRVIITLDDAQGEEFNYQSASASISPLSSSFGSAQFTRQEADRAEITFTAGIDIPASQQIQIDVTSITYDNGNLGTYTAVFTRSDGGSESDTYSDFK